MADRIRSKKVFSSIAAGLVVLMFGSGCALRPKSDVRLKRYRKQILKLSRQITEQKRVNDSLREENAVLRILTSTSKSGSSVNMKKHAKLEKDKSLYLKLVTSYNLGQLERVRALGRLLRKQYPKSRFADETLYLVGEMLLERGQIGAAIQAYSDQLATYPKGNKVAAGLLSKGRAYSRLNISASAKKYFDEVQNRFPGSSEAASAQLEAGKL